MLSDSLIEFINSSQLQEAASLPSVPVRTLQGNHRRRLLWPAGCTATLAHETKLVLCGRTVLRKYVLILLCPSRKIFQGPTLRTYSAIRTGQSDRPTHGNHQPESRDLISGNKHNGHYRNQTHILLFFTGRKTVRIHLQPCHPIRFQTSKDGHGEYPEKSSPEPLSVL